MIHRCSSCYLKKTGASCLNNQATNCRYCLQSQKNSCFFQPSASCSSFYVRRWAGALEYIVQRHNEKAVNNISHLLGLKQRSAEEAHRQRDSEEKRECQSSSESIIHTKNNGKEKTLAAVI